MSVNAKLDPEDIAETFAEAHRTEQVNAARAAMPASEYLDSLDLEHMTGTPASTWRYWAHIGSGPASFKLGRRRVWKRSTVLTWLESQEAASA
jgi:prophage regulatory protein